MTLQEGLNRTLQLLDHGLFQGQHAPDVLRAKAFLQQLLDDNTPKEESNPPQ